jgi:medium-chain acyl-[acyl-carrier-protein] hydrolase
VRQARPVTRQWIRPYRRPEAVPARCRLYLFPYAGGGASAFRGWGARLGGSVEVAGVQLPGREDRIAEPLVGDFDELSDHLFDAFMDSADLPFALFGHSLGALLAYEMAHRVRDAHGISPLHLFVSAYRAPHLPDPWDPVDSLSEADLIARLRDMDGTPTAIFDSRDLAEVYLPIMRSDLLVAESYTHRDRPPLRCPVTALGGDADPEVAVTELAAWGEHTLGKFSTAVFPGRHFYYRQHEDRITALIGAAVNTTADS